MCKVGKTHTHAYTYMHHITTTPSGTNIQILLPMKYVMSFHTDMSTIDIW